MAGNWEAFGQGGFNRKVPLTSSLHRLNREVKFGRVQILQLALNHYHTMVTPLTTTQGMEGWGLAFGKPMAGSIVGKPMAMSYDGKVHC